MKRLIAFFLALLMIFALTACTGNPDPTPSEPPVEDPEPSATIPDTADPLSFLTTDSYWVAYESEGDMREYVPEGDNLLTDLTLWADGTARIREIEDGVWLVSEGDEQNMTWTCEDDGTLNLYTQHSGATPYWSGTVTAEGITLNRFGGTYRFRQEPIPEGGALYSPAELQGVWMISHAEIDGDEADVSGDFDTLVFERDWVEDGKTLLASSEYGGGGYLIREGDNSAYHFRGITPLDQPIYSGCGNEEWSVRIGEESPLNEHGYPENTEIYVTLLDQNTLLQQQYFSFDNGTIPGVSYQIYKRFLPQACYDLGQSDLEGCYFELAGYIDADGNRSPAPDGISNYTIYLHEYGYDFTVTFADGTDYRGGGGYWEMGAGGTLHMTSEGNDADWLAGAVQSFNDIPELYLWYDGGILRLEYAEHTPDGDSDPEGYVDTMSDLEGNAFAAPENTLCVIYNHNYAKSDDLHYFSIDEIDDGPEAQYVLVTSVMDDTYFWLEADGFCIGDFGTVNAGDSFIFRINIPESNGPRLQIESSMGNYFFELTQSSMDMYQNWNYITT